MAAQNVPDWLALAELLAKGDSGIYWLISGGGSVRVGNRNQLHPSYLANETDSAWPHCGH